MPTKKTVEKPYHKTIHTLRYVNASELFTQDVMRLVNDMFVEIDDPELRSTGSIYEFLRDPELRSTGSIYEFLRDQSCEEENSEQLRKELTWAMAEIEKIPAGVFITTA